MFINGKKCTLQLFMQQTQMHEITIYPIKNTQSLQVSLFYSNQSSMWKY